MDNPVGRIVWFDYLTSEPAKAQKFHSTLFGWKTQRLQMLTGEIVTAIFAGDRMIGGYAAPLQGTPVYRFSEPWSRWLPHLQIANAHETAGKVKTHSAKIVKEPTPFLDIGRFAIGTDPNGQAFGAIQPLKKTEDLGWAGGPNTFCWAELYTLSPGSSCNFYKSIAGFTETKNQLPDGTYHMLEKDGAPRAGVRTPMKGTQPGWFAWIRVPDLIVTANKALQLESTFIMPPANGMALLVDPWGATFGLAQA